MSRSPVKAVFGVHSWSPYNITNGLPYGMVDCLKGSSLAISGEVVELTGGSNRWAWDVQDGKMSGEGTVKPASYDAFLVELFLGKAPTESSADSTGTVGTIANVYGETAVDSSTGIASASIKTDSNSELKFGTYIVKVVSSTTVDVYCLSDVDFARGTDLSFQDDDLKVTASALTITASSAVEIPNTGVELTGGSGVIAMTVGHTAKFTVKPISTRSWDVTIGASTDIFPSFGSYMVAQKKGDAGMFDLDVFRCKGLGFPINMEESAHSELEIKFKVYQKSASDGVMSMRYIEPATFV